MKNLSKQKLAFIDLETTGLDDNIHEIIEIGVLVYNQESDEVEKEWSTKIAPSNLENAQNQALIINGYINNPNSYNGKLKPSLIKFNSIVKDCVLIGQNIEFDLAFIRRDMFSNNIKPAFKNIHLELMSLAWFAIKDADISGMSLESLCHYFNVCNVGAHSALVDCRRAYTVYRKLQNIYKP